MEALTEEDEPEVLTTRMEASAEETEETTRPSECLQRQRCRCFYGIGVLMTTTASSTEYDGPTDSVTTTEASAEDEEYTTCLRYWRQKMRRRVFRYNDGGCGVTTTGVRNWQPRRRRR